MEKFNKALYKGKETDYSSQERRDVFEYIPKKISNLLDVGCSNGLFGKYVKTQLGIPVFGIEPFNDSFKKANKNLDYVYNGVLDRSLKLPEKKVDCITFNDVLEHLNDPWEALVIAKEYLTENGCIVISLPNIQCYNVIKELIIKQDFKYMNSGILDKTHLRFFTKKSMQRMFDETGFEIIVMDGIGDITKGSRIMRFLTFILGKRLDGFRYQGYIIRLIKKKTSITYMTNPL